MSVEPSRVCLVCGAPGSFINFGVRSCSSCKMFFKRNAELPQKKFSCEARNRCEVDVFTRRICSACRLAKCFACGMQVQLIRGMRSRKSQKHTAKASVQLSTLNLLQHSDQSMLTNNQWVLFSNLVHCYDQHSNLSMAEQFIAKQNALPLKLRYKYEFVLEFVTSNNQHLERIFERNVNFLSLSMSDRSSLLRRTVKQIGGFGGTLVLHQSGILDDPLFHTSSELIFTPTAMSAIQSVRDAFDSDSTFNKLVLGILAFSTTTYTSLADRFSTDFSDLKAILQIQDSYTEITWKYLVYKHNYEQAVRRFCQLVRCLFRVNEVIMTVDRIQEYIQMIDTVVQKTEELFIQKK